MVSTHSYLALAFISLKFRVFPLGGFTRFSSRQGESSWGFDVTRLQGIDWPERKVSCCICFCFLLKNIHPVRRCRYLLADDRIWKPWWGMLLCFVTLFHLLTTQVKSGSPIMMLLCCLADDEFYFFHLGFCRTAFSLIETNMLPKLDIIWYSFCYYIFFCCLKVFNKLGSCIFWCGGPSNELTLARSSCVQMTDQLSHFFMHFSHRLHCSLWMLFVLTTVGWNFLLFL